MIAIGGSASSAFFAIGMGADVGRMSSAGAISFTTGFDCCVGAGGVGAGDGVGATDCGLGCAGTGGDGGAADFSSCVFAGVGDGLIGVGAGIFGCTGADCVIGATGAGVVGAITACGFGTVIACSGAFDGAGGGLAASDANGLVAVCAGAGAGAGVTGGGVAIGFGAGAGSSVGAGAGAGDGGLIAVTGVEGVAD